MSSPKKLDYRMMPERAEQGLHDLATDIRDALRKHESGEVQTTESKSSGITNIMNCTGSWVDVDYQFRYNTTLVWYLKL